MSDDKQCFTQLGNCSKEYILHQLHVAYELNAKLKYISDMLNNIFPSIYTRDLEVLFDKNSTIATLAKDHLDYVGKSLSEKYEVKTDGL